ncbi:MAG: TlpA disulfide reductase family protein [Ignavibacteriaceae bacterium]
MESQSSDQFLKAGNNYFKIANITPDGKYLTLVRQNVTSETQGTQPDFKAMDFNAKTVSGNPISLKDLRGKYVYLDFWGSWCMPCREEIPGLKKLYEDYKDKSFIIIGIANDRAEKLKKFVKENNISWPQILEEKDKKIIYKYKISGYPTTFLINPAGTILYKNLRFKELGDKLAKIFKN